MKQRVEFKLSNFNSLISQDFAIGISPANFIAKPFTVFEIL